MAQDKMMTQTLTSLLEEGETIQHPIYGTLLQGRQFWYGYFCLTDTHLLIALLEGNTDRIYWTTRIPLEIREFSAQKSSLLGQYKMRVKFDDGRNCTIRASKKVVGIQGQDAHLSDFMAALQNLAN